MYARLQRAAEKVGKADPSRLKPARDDKNKGLERGAEAPHYPSPTERRIFLQPVKGVLHPQRIEQLWNCLKG
jgi:hypothetical protein